MSSLAASLLPGLTKLKVHRVVTRLLSTARRFDALAHHCTTVEHILYQQVYKTSHLSRIPEIEVASSSVVRGMLFLFTAVNTEKILLMIKP